MLLISSFLIVERWQPRLGPLQFFRLFIAVFFLIASLSSLCLADGWAPVLEETSLVPDYIVAVDKKKQKLHILVHKSPLHAEASFTCATGQVEGDKAVEGDLKTPEGVYFTTGKRTGLSDFSLYGTMAFPLDFPNPVDRIKGKTGYGIWLHGRGKKLVPMDTKGCVAMVNADLSVVDSKIRPGSAVVIAQSLEWEKESGNQGAEALLLEDMVLNWAENWEHKSPNFFKAYSPERFSKSDHKTFKQFKKRKKRIFASTGWIDVEIFNLQALPGPDYWVTWFDQYYRSGKLSSSTSKRLYWQNIGGKWKIVGREYGPKIKSLKKDYLKRKTDSVEKFIGQWRERWLKADLHDYMACYDAAAQQGSRKGAATIKQQKKTIWSERKPAVIELGKIELKEHPDGLEVAFRQKYSDVTGYSDNGRKHIVIRPHGDSWLIVDEQWRKL